MGININSSYQRSDDFDRDDDSGFEDEFSGDGESRRNLKGKDRDRSDRNVSNRGENARANPSAKGHHQRTVAQTTDSPQSTRIIETKPSQGSTVSLSTTANAEKISVDLDVLESSPAASASPRSIAANAEKPTLPEADPAQKNVQEAVRDAQKSNETPKKEDLLKLLPKGTREILDSLFAQEEGASMDPKKFFDMLSKIIPLSMTLLQGSGKGIAPGSVDISETLASMTNEMEAILQKHGDSSSLSAENKNLLENLARQLKLMGSEESLAGNLKTLGKEIEALISQATGKSVDVSSQQTLVKQLVEAQLIPSSLLNGSKIPVKVFEQALTSIQQLSGMNLQQTSTHPTVETLVQMNHLFASVKAFPPEQRAQVIQIMMRTQGLFSTGTSQGMLGPNTQQFTKDISQFLMNITQGIGMIPASKKVTNAGSQYLSRVIGELILAGAILGRMVVDKGDGKAMELNEAMQIGQAQMKATRELGIIDLVPFSFLAFFAPFEGMGGGKSKAEKEAIDALMKFIRTFMSLLLMLVAIYTGGKKIGDNGVNIMLSTNADYIRGNIDNLIFCLKKLDELYGVNVKQPIQRCGRAKIALDAENYDEFWDHIIGFLTEKGDLFGFLEEVDQLDPLYESIHTLLKETGLEHLSIMRM